ncbi:arginase family protein, partial [Chloroflexota bacterium]
IAEEAFQNPLPDNEKEINKWISNGVHLATKEEVSSEKLTLNLGGPVYISIDMDVGSLASVYSARFMNCYGLELSEFLALISQLSVLMKECGVPLVGMDIMEIDIHFLEAAKSTQYTDHTRYIARKALEILLNDQPESQ